MNCVKAQERHNKLHSLINEAYNFKMEFHLDEAVPIHHNAPTATAMALKTKAKTKANTMNGMQKL